MGPFVRVDVAKTKLCALLRLLDSMTRLLQTRHLDIAALVAAISVTLLGAACAGGDDGSSNTDESGRAHDLVAASREVLGKQQEYAVRFKITEQAPDATYTTEGEAAYQAGELAYARMSLNGGPESGRDVNELLFIPLDMYLRTQGGEWFVQSPWSQGIRPEKIPKGGLGNQILDYKVITGAMTETKRLSDEPLAGVTYAHLASAAELKDLAAGDKEAAKLLEDAHGSGEVELWLQVESHLPFKLQVRTDTKINRVEVVTTMSYEFFNFNQTITVPKRPADVRPYRDLEFPEAPCTGAQFAACLGAQAELQSVAQSSCRGGAKRVCLVPMGKVSAALALHLVEYYQKQYGLTVTILTASAVPAEMSDPLRQQVDAAALISYMGSLFPDARDDPKAVLIGITAVDLYDKTSHFRYLFGLKGPAEDPKAMVSFFRMTPEFYGQASNEELFFARARKLLSKYVGFLYYGLPPSDDPQSPMFNNILGPDDLDRMQEPLPGGR